MNFFSQLTIINALALLLLSFGALAKVEPPNYDFSLDSFKIFMPGSSLLEIKKKYPKIEIQKKEKGLILYKVYVKQIRYKFPVLFQVRNNSITDFYARLPAYFLHDIFHQSIINRFGKQNKYYKREEAAVYVWNKKDLTHVYSGGCTITCFPIYYTVYKSVEKKNSIFMSLNSQQ